MADNIVNQAPAPSGGEKPRSSSGGWVAAVIVLIVLVGVVFLFGPGRKLIIREPEGTTTIETR